tara:strand:+ start:1608 stop:1793 length:186 start_codon:yes stop_codon:yes gene_type:complete
MSEDLDEQPRALRPKPLDLDVMSISELSEYIGELESEIERIRSAIVRKEEQKLAADAVFKG